MDENKTEAVLYEPDKDNFLDEHPEGDSKRMQDASEPNTTFVEKEVQDDGEDVPAGNE